MTKSTWSLRTSLTLLLTGVTTVSFLIVAIVLLLFRIPQIAEETQLELRVEATDLAERSEIILGTLKTQLELIASTLDHMPEQRAQGILERAVGEHSAFTAIYQISLGGTIIRAAVDPNFGAGRRHDLVGSDLSRDPLFLRTRDQKGTVWSDKFLSPVSSAIAVGIGIASDDTIITGEIPLSYILKTLRTARGKQNLMVWIVDRRGEILADSEENSRVGVTNVASVPLFQIGQQSAQLQSGHIVFEGRRFEAAVAHSKSLNWYFLTRTPGGASNPHITSMLDLGVAALIGSVLLGLLLAPLWASRMARPIHAINSMARRLAGGEPPGLWPRGAIIELDDLSGNIEFMADALQKRTQELEAVFEASPIGLAVVAPEQQNALIKINSAFLQLFLAEREAMIGRNFSEMSIGCDAQVATALFSLDHERQYAEAETRLRRSDGSTLLAAMATRSFVSGREHRIILVARDVTEMRRIEQEIRTLNTELEERVNQRTQQLHQANKQLTTTLETLRQTQQELVRTEKLASLGSLVAGIAHELNTPLGNGLIAVSTLRSELDSFRDESMTGIRKSSLDRLLEATATGVDIAQRNLTRASELINSFKQVAADQTSSRRRTFQLDEVVREIVLTLQPQLRRNQVTIEAPIPEGIEFDGYPGPLGQVLANLIVNADMHAFEGRTERLITVTTIASGPERVVMQVRDNGCGIPSHLLPRIFDPFVTTRMGRGGTGIGLHIVHNIVTNILGGTISVESEIGKGATFTINLPIVAPVQTVSISDHSPDEMG